VDTKHGWNTLTTKTYNTKTHITFLNETGMLFT
jgi:hypothetical protein